MKLTLVKCDSMDDWYTIERLEHDGSSWFDKIGPHSFSYQHSSRFSDADVEGHAEEMLGIAKAIEKRGAVYYKRCSVRVEGNKVFFSSPRNSQKDGICSLEEADLLVAEIRNKLNGK